MEESDIFLTYNKSTGLRSGKNLYMLSFIFVSFGTKAISI